MKRGLSKRCYMFFKVLANPTRLGIMEALLKDSKNVNEIAKSMKQEQSMISHNLEPLEECGLIFSERSEKQRVYSLNKETVVPLFELFDFHSKKYCPANGSCHTEEGIRQLRKKEAATEFHITHM